MLEKFNIIGRFFILMCYFKFTNINNNQVIVETSKIGVALLHEMPRKKKDGVFFKINLNKIYDKIDCYFLQM